VTMAPEEIEIYRNRWRRTRARLQLADPLSDAFGTGGLARHAPEVHVRLLILPADPEATVVELDEGLWDWWMQDRPNPFEGASPTKWGGDALPEASAAVRFNRWTGDRWNWDGYLALLRSGGLEFGLGTVGSRIWGRRDEGAQWRVFFLTTIVGRIWVALALFGEIRDRYALQGSSQATLALRESSLAMLANVAAGWREPDEVFPLEEVKRCPDPGVLIVREVLDWPDADGVRALAFAIGANIEDAFGFRERRFLARTEPGAGAFDASRYRSEP